MDVNIPSHQLSVAADIAADAQALHQAFLDESASPFDVLYGTYRLLLRGIAVRKFAVPLRDAEDLVHDVFATYLANPTDVRNVHSYLIGGICNASRQYRRRERSTPFCEASSRTDCAATPDDELLNSVIGSVVIQATLARLGSSCRETLARFYLLGETTVAIAQSRDTSANYIARLLSYCRNRARSICRQIHNES
jgi:DNA-directed RNA polymerase specialized sigma24 family protein